MASPFKEMFHQGVVTARDASLLGDGEVAQADDCIYRPNDPAIWKAPGRTAYGTVNQSVIASVVTVSGNAAITKSNGFGTGVSSTTTLGSTTITSAAGFTSGMVGQRVTGTGIAPHTFVQSFTNSSTVILTNPATAAGTVTLTFSSYEPGMFVSGTGIQADSVIVTVDSASQITLDKTASANGTVLVTIAPPNKALLYLDFPVSKGDRLVTYAGSKLYSSAYTAATGTFASLIDNMKNNGGETAEIVQNGETYILLATGNAPRRLYYKDVGGTDTLSSRIVGMQPLRQLLAEVVSGSWPISLGNATYYFLVTEVFNPDQEDEVEGTFEGDPVYATISDYTTQAIRITRTGSGSTSNISNTGLSDTNAATHWRVYMAPGQPNILPKPSFTLFRRVATVSIAQATVTLATSNAITPEHSAQAQDASGYTYAYANGAGLLGSAVVTVGSCAGTNGLTVLTTGGTFASVVTGMPVYGTNIGPGARVLSKQSTTSITLTVAHTGTVSGTISFGPGDSLDGNYARDFVVTNVGIPAPGVRLSNFGFQDVTAYTGKTVVGVRVWINYKWDNREGSDNSGEDRGFNIYMKVSGSATSTKFNVGNRTGEGNTPTFGGNRFGWLAVGGPGDTWGRTWNAGLLDFVDGTIFLHIEKAASAQFQQHWIDSVHLQVFFSGIDVTLDGEPFKTVVFTSQVGETIAVGAAGPPPLCDTGDVLDGQLIVNDLSAPTSLVASLPDDYEAFPSTYKVNLASRRIDPIVVFRRVGAIGVVWGRSTIKRLNYFPQEIDADGSRGKAWDEIANDHGLAAKQGVAVFDMPGRGVLAAYIAPNGLWLTDGITCWTANDDLDWAATVSITGLNTARLVSYPGLYLIAMYYTPAGGTYNTKVLYFSYHPSHIKEGGKLAAVGPVQCRASSAARADLNGISKLFTGNLSDGKVYLEDNGNTSEDANVTITPAITTRQIYASDVGSQSRVERVWVRAGAAGTSVTGVCTASILRQNIGENRQTIDPILFTTDATTLTDDKLIVIHSDNLSESFQLKITKADLNAPFRLHYASFLGEGYGLEKNRA